MELAGQVGASPGQANAISQGRTVLQDVRGEIATSQAEASFGVMDAIDRHGRDEIDTLRELNELRRLECTMGEQHMTATAELVTAMETRIALGRSRAGLLRLKADLRPQGDPEADKLREDAEQAESDALAWSLAAQCLREAISMNAEMTELLTGWPASVQRPKLRLVDPDDWGGDATP